MLRYLTRENTFSSRWQRTFQLHFNPRLLLMLAIKLKDEKGLRTWDAIHATQVNSPSAFNKERVVPRQHQILKPFCMNQIDASAVCCADLWTIVIQANGLKGNYDVLRENANTKHVSKLNHYNQMNLIRPWAFNFLRISAGECLGDSE